MNLDLKFKTFTHPHSLCKAIRNCHCDAYKKVRDEYGLQFANFLRDTSCSSSVKAVVVFHEDRPIGLLKYTVHCENVMATCGTYVSPQYRKKGIAKILWERTIKRNKIKEVDVTTVTVGGTRFVKSFKKRRKALDCKINHVAESESD